MRQERRPLNLPPHGPRPRGGGARRQARLRRLLLAQGGLHRAAGGRLQERPDLRGQAGGGIGPRCDAHALLAQGHRRLERDERAHQLSPPRRHGHVRRPHDPQLPQRPLRHQPQGRVRDAAAVGRRLRGHHGEPQPDRRRRRGQPMAALPLDRRLLDVSPTGGQPRAALKTRVYKRGVCIVCRASPDILPDAKHAPLRKNPSLQP
mmetsp:Transcript_51038/g.122654  ORF Transcript_51038/g.122654 Transcript_51038/m.122654 type:complete len:205 (+) Transcript_51038:464-1078(+)